jgi:hypothetical protein
MKLAGIPMHKPITAAIMAALVSAGGVLAPTLTSTAASAVIAADPEANTLLFDAYPFDTQAGALVAPAPFSMNAAPGATLQIIQFSGPVQQRWLDMLSARGIRPLQYVANNGYIVWTDADARARLMSLRSSASWLQYASPLYGFFKVTPLLAKRLGGDANLHDEVDVTVQMYSHAGAGDTQRFIESRAIIAPQQLGPLGSGKVSPNWARDLAFQTIVVRVHASDIQAIAERPDVTSVDERLPAKMMDEKQGIIMSGDFAPGPATPSYLQFLIDRGFSQTATDYPVVDVTDSTINEGGTGVTAVNTADPMLHVQGDIAQASRVAYFKNCSSQPDTSVGAIDGHGSLNGSIIGDFDQRTGYPFQDADGQHLGLGINPFGRVGSTAIFVPGYDISGCGGTDQGVILANWQNGARISTNSWGLNGSAGAYNAGARAYDVGVRDADPGASGNQELIYLFAAGNSGPGTGSVNSPGTAKNVITVGASENLRPFPAPPGNHCGPDPAANPENVVGFSGRGPVAGQRVKPEVLAPGTHIQAGASIYSGYTGAETCVKYYPQSPAQQIFTYSSGTSHSTPATAGTAQLAYWWIENGGAGPAAGTLDEIGGNRAPSPALMKAWLMAHPTYLTGTSANDNLPSNNQGYGMPNMSNMFDTTPKVIVDQSEVFDNVGESRTYAWGIVDPDKPVRIAMSYTDAPGAIGTSPQVNNLDLSVTVGGQTYLGNHFTHEYSTTGGTADSKNNYEAVFLPAGTVGDVTITVTATNIAGDGVPNVGDATDQDFALVCSNCSQAPSFTLSTFDHTFELCTGADFFGVVTIGSIQSFADPVSLALSGVPDSAIGNVAPDTVTPGSSATVSVTNTATVPAGDYTMTLTGTSGSIIKTLDFDLTYASEAPAVPILDAPADGTTNTTLTPTLTWEASPQASSYLVEVATDSAFATVVASATVTDTAWTVTPALDSNTQFYWRVTALNACGDSSGAGADRIFGDGFEGEPLPPIGTSQSFVTMALPGDCSIGSTQQVIWSDDLESGAGDWTHTGTGDTWTLGTTAAHSATHAWQANNATSVTDQQLVSPSVVIPANLSGLTLAFWNQQSFESNGTTGCFDGAIVETSTNGGTTWTQITSGLLTDPYDGPVSTGYSNPLAGKQAWCGDPQVYLNSVIDIQAFAGQTVKFRFRMANDNSTAHIDPGWAIDDVKVAGCATN